MGNRGGAWVASQVPVAERKFQKHVIVIKAGLETAGLWLLAKELGGARGSRPGSRVAEKVKLGRSRLPCATDTSLLLLKFSSVGFGE